MTYSILGIDISKLKFDVALILDNGKLRHKVFPNTGAGFAQLSAWLTKHKVEGVHACLEATGTYAEPLAMFLFEAGYVVSVVNPAKIKAYAQSHLSRTKTDKADATLIAQFCQERQPPAWQPLPQEIRDLQAMVRRLESLQEMRQMEGNRLEAGVGADMVRDSLVEHIAYLDQKIAHTEALIRDHISSHPKLRGQRQLLLSIPGIGETTAAKFLAEILDVSLYQSARQPSSLCRSGTSSTRIRHEREEESQTLKDRHTAVTQGTLLAGHLGDPPQPAGACPKLKTKRARQVSDAESSARRCANSSTLLLVSSRVEKCSSQR